MATQHNKTSPGGSQPSVDADNDDEDTGGRRRDKPRTNGNAGQAGACEIAIWSSANGVLTKRIELAADGTKLVTPAAAMWTGRARRVPINGVHELAATINQLKYNEAFTTGRLREGHLPSKVNVTTKGRLDGRDTAIARTRDYVEFVAGMPAFLLFDYDSKGKPAEIEVTDYWAMLCEVAPGLRDAARMVRYSTSSGVYRTDTGEELPGSDGLHTYVVAKDGSDSARFLTALHQRCWLAGYGWIMLSRAGQMLERSIVDRIVGAPERLCFEAPPMLQKPLAQHAEKRQPIAIDGKVIDTRAVCPPLTAAERRCSMRWWRRRRRRSNRNWNGSRRHTTRCGPTIWSSARECRRRRPSGSSGTVAVACCCPTTSWSSTTVPWASARWATCSPIPSASKASRSPTRSKASRMAGRRPWSCCAERRWPWIKSHAHGDVTYSLQDDRVPKAAETDDIAPDDPRLAKLGKEWIALGFTGEGAEAYESRRHAALALAVECVKAGVAEHAITAVLMNGKLVATAGRIVAQAHEFLVDPELFKMNEKHAVLPIGGKTRVATWSEDPEVPGYQSITSFSPFGDFKALNDKYRLSVEVTDAKGNTTMRMMGRGTWWIHNSDRRRYDDGMRFMPESDDEVVNKTLNMWHGFRVAARKPEGKSGAAGCNLLLEHGFRNICSGDAGHFDYLMKRRRSSRQRRTRSEIALALHTKEEGTAKASGAGTLTNLYGAHAMQVHKPEHVIGKTSIWKLSAAERR